MYLNNKIKAMVLLVLLIAIAVTLTLPTAVFAESSRQEAVYDEVKRQVDRKESIKNLPNNDVDQIPKRKVYSDTNGRGPDGSVSGDLALAEVKFEVTGRDADGIPNKYTAHVVYRGEETCKTFSHYETVYGGGQSQGTPAAPESRSGGRAGTGGHTAAGQGEAGAAAKTGADSASEKDEESTLAVVSKEDVIPAPVIIPPVDQPDKTPADSGETDGDSAHEDNAAIAKAPDSPDIGGGTGTSEIDGTSATGANSLFDRVQAMLSSLSGSLSPIGAAALATLVAAILTLLLLGIHNRRAAARAQNPDVRNAAH